VSVGDNGKMSVRSVTQKTAKDTKQGRKTWQKKGKRHERRGKRLHFVGITKNRDVLNDSDTHTKNTYGLVFLKVVALKGPVVKNMVYCCLARSVHARFL